MAWFAELAGKAENLLNNLDEQTGAALRNHNVMKSKKYDRHELPTQADPAWAQKRRPIPNYMKKAAPESKKLIPKRNNPIIIPSTITMERGERTPLERHLSPKRKAMNKKYNLHSPPHTLVCDVKDDSNSEMMLNMEGVTYRMENLEIENAMLQNEHNVLNREISDLVDKLQQRDHELKVSMERAQSLKDKQDADAKLSATLERLKSENEAFTAESKKLKETIHNLETEIVTYKQKICEFDNSIKVLNGEAEVEKELRTKLENDLRHAQSTVGDLKCNLLKSNAECKRLEKDWETYKLRVKTMLSAKDKEVKALQMGHNFTEDGKILIEQMETMKNERAVLSETIDRIRSENQNLKQYAQSLESRNGAAERVVVALRDALKEERSSRTRAEAQCNAATKELRTIQIETGETILNLRSSVNKKEEELQRVRECKSYSTECSALNVADYDIARSNVDDEKVILLTQKLIQKQGQIDSLKTDNNIMRMRLQKLEAKIKFEWEKKQTVLHVQENERKVIRLFPFRMSWNVGTLVRQYPIVKMFIMAYVVILHFWVVTVLFSNTPEPQILSNARQITL